MSLIQPTSRVENILKSKIDGTTYDKPPLSRVEALLLELEAGGGGTDNYNELTNKPSINGNVLIGDQTGEELGLAEWKDV